MSLRSPIVPFALATLLAMLSPPTAVAAPGAGAGAADAAAEAPGVPLAKTFPAWISLDAEGRVTAVEVNAGNSDAVATAVEALVREVAFAPATRAGSAVASDVPASIGVRFTPDADGTYATELRWLDVLPVRADRMSPARYPVRELRGAVGGWVTVGYVVGADARVDTASIEVIDQGAWKGRRLLGAGDAATKAFAAATRESVAQWTFTMARLDGTPVSARLSTPMTFRPHDDRDPAGDLPAFVQTAQAAVPPPVLPGDGLQLPSPAAALPETPPARATDDIRITGSRVRRGSVELP